MTASVWWAKVLRFLSGREGIERKTESYTLEPLELPDIEPPDRSYGDGRDGEKQHLERKRREHDREIARLRAIAQSRTRGS